MRCTRCGNELAQGAAFCSRCGARMLAPKPAAVREYALATFRPSLWRMAHAVLTGIAFIAVGAVGVGASPQFWHLGFAVIGFGILVIVMAFLTNRFLTWNVTSDRLIERRGFLSSRRREMELADIRSVEVDQRFLQRVVGLGNITIASAASADYSILLNNIRNPEAAADMIRQARLKRLA
jgi:uncharacterized membrane protein YdbT with pleckstrin-like domain